MRLRRRAVGLSLILLMLTYDFHVAILALANGQTSGYVVAEGTSSNDFFRKQLEEGIPPDEPLLERRYIIPSGMNVKHADEIWLTVASLISLGYDEEELAKTLSESVLPRKLEANNIAALIDYANLRITRNLEDGGVSVEIPVLCNSSLPSTYYEVRGAKKRIKLCNVTSIKYYNVSLNARELYNVTYSSGETGRASEAAIDFSGGIKNHLVNAYLPNPKDPVPTEVRIGLLSHGVTLSLRVLEHRVHKIIFNGREVDCYWIHVNRTLKAARDVRSVMLSIGYDGVWITRSWLILRKGGYVSDHWIKWTPSDRLTIDLCIEGFRSTFMLNFHENASIGQGVIKEVLSEDCLKELLEQPFYEKLNLSRAPKSWSIKLAGEKVTNETLWATGKEYEWLMRVGCRKGNSLFIDSGEAEWEYAVTNRTLGSCNSIKLFYNPLKVNKGELVHGLTLRNYASENVSYTLRLRTTSNHFFFFSKVEEGSGGITVNEASTSSMLLVQQEPAVGDAVLELVKDGRVVAAVKVSLAIKATMFWKGFWDGLASKLPGIMITAGVMMAMGFLIPHAYVRPAYYLLLGIGVLSNLLEIALDAAEAYRARDEMLLLADAVENRSIELLAKGSVEHAAECKSFALALRKEANETMSSLIPNVLLDLTIGVSLDEIRVAIGLKEPLARDELERQYKIGYARGKVTGAVISCVLYVTLFVMINRVKAERIGQHLTTSQILRTMAKGFYNWITPSIWDATILVIEKKGGKFLSRVIDLFLGNSYSTRLGEAVGSLVDGIRAKLGDDCPEVGEALEYSSSICKQVIENVPSRESSSRILELLGEIIGAYSWEEVEDRGGAVARSIVSMWMKDGDEALNSLSEWIETNSNDPLKVKLLADEILAGLDGNIPRGLGPRIGEIADAYFRIRAEHGVRVAEIFTGCLSRRPELLIEERNLERLTILMGELGELGSDGLKNLKVALEDNLLLEELLDEPEFLSKVLLNLKDADYYEYTNRRIDAGGHVYLGERIEPGCYKIIAEIEVDGETRIVSWSTRTEGNDYVYVPKSLREELNLQEGEPIMLRIVKFIPEIHFPRSFRGGIFSLDFLDNKLRVGGLEVTGSRFNLDETMFDTRKGFTITVETSVRSATGTGIPLVLRLYEDGSVSFVKRTVAGEIVDDIDCLSLKNTFEGLILKEGGLERTVRSGEGEILYLELESGGHKYIFPLKTLSYEEGRDYKIHVGAEGGKTTALLTYLKIIFGCDTVEQIRNEMEAGKLKLVATLEDGTKATTREPRLEITNESLDIFSIGFYQSMLEPKFEVLKDAYIFLRSKGITDDELCERIVDRYFEVMRQDAAYIEHISKTMSEHGKGLLGEYGEYLVIENDAERVKAIQYRIRIDGKSHIIDIVETDRIVEAKYWIDEDSYRIWFAENLKAFKQLVEELRACKHLMEQQGLKKIYLVFGKKVLDDNTFNNYMQKLRDALGGDTSWLVTCNGFEAYKKAGGG